MSTNTYAREIDSRQRFEFGENWRRFLSVVDEDRIAEARRSLTEMLELSSLEGLRVLDIGSGSGLFSLAAVQLGASSVHSFDFDPSSVSCARELRRRFASTAEHWTIGGGDVLNRSFLEALGTFDVVYSWGVLHHTGDMYRALDHAAIPVAPGGRLFISIYNDQGRQSRVWRRIKQIYNRLPSRLRPAFVILAMGPRELRYAFLATIRLRPHAYVRSWTQYKRQRGMSRAHDLVDWVGGYPFEVAAPEVIFDFYRVRGFRLERLKTCAGGLGCNQFVFTKSRAPDR